MQKSRGADPGKGETRGPISFPGIELSDEALLSAIADREEWAMSLLYDRYSHILYSLAYHMVADHQIAEDLSQEAFLAVWRRANSYSPQTGVARSWIISILHHRAIDYLRSLRRRTVLKEATLEEAELDESTAFPDAWDETWRSVQSAQVRAALMQLSPEQRLVIELAYFQGWTHSKIAEECKLPLGTTKARMRLGIRHLKHILQQMGVYEI